MIGDRIAAICSAHNVTVDYAFQDIKDIPPHDGHSRGELVSSACSKEGH